MPKAAVCPAVNEPLEVVDVALGDPQAGEVRIRMGASGVCHSDLSVVNGTLLSPLPSVLGHEGAGVVDAVGEGVNRVQPGDHVVLSFVPQCGTCYMCTHDTPEMCETGFLAMAMGAQLDMTPRFSRDGSPLHQMSALGTFSEELVCPEISVVKIDDDVPFTSAALIGCGVLTGFGAAANTADISRGDTVAVVGCGGVGLNAIQGAKWKGAERIIAVDRFDSKLDMAKQFGATDLVNAGDGDPVGQVQELTGGRGVDVAFEVIGLKETVQQAFAMTRRGGQAIIVGVPKMEQIMEIPIAMELLVNEKQVRGSWYGSSDVRRDVPRLVALYKDGALKLDELVSRRINLDGINDAFESMVAGEVARSVVDYGI
ncbi:MAG TPA: Zn-dependent alcohol dehydrogenase [Acidimicrobiia bacterium]|nr:Zn-dependent alcohol dehydrogenase [Acidimicrobiia bacterium]